MWSEISGFRFDALASFINSFFTQTAKANVYIWEIVAAWTLNFEHQTII